MLQVGKALVQLQALVEPFVFEAVEGVEKAQVDEVDEGAWGENGIAHNPLHH